MCCDYNKRHNNNNKDSHLPRKFTATLNLFLQCTLLVKCTLWPILKVILFCEGVLDFQYLDMLHFKYINWCKSWLLCVEGGLSITVHSCFRVTQHWKQWLIEASSVCCNPIGKQDTFSSCQYTLQAMLSTKYLEIDSCDHWSKCLQRLK